MMVAASSNDKVPPEIWFAEDDDEDWLLIQDVLDEDCKSRIRYKRVKNGLEMLDALKSPLNRLPALIFLDMKMPKLNGSDTLQEIRKDPALRHIPVVILTTSNLEADIFKAYHGGANSYLVKPATFPAMADVLKAVHRYWTTVTHIPDPNMARGA